MPQRRERRAFLVPDLGPTASLEAGLTTRVAGVRGEAREAVDGEVCGGVVVEGLSR